MAKRSRNALSYFVLALAIAVEIYTYVIPVLLSQIDFQPALITFIFTTIFRVVFFISVSFYFGGFGDWWKKYLTLDVLVPVTFALSTVYGFFYLSPKDGIEEWGWRIGATIAFPFLLFSLNGHVRCLVKFFPWDRWTLLIYRLNRAAAVAVVVIIEGITFNNSDELIHARNGISPKFDPCLPSSMNCTVGFGNSTTEYASAQYPTNIAESRWGVVFFGVIISYYCTLFAVTPKWETLRKLQAKAEK